MTLDEAIEYEEKIVDDHNRIKQIKAVTLEECKYAEKHLQIADWLKLLKNIQSTGDCNVCKSKGMCEYEPELGQMVRYNCPFYKEERIIKMTYGDIYEQFCKKFPNTEVNDYRPAYPQYLPSLVKPIPYAIVVWLKDGSKVVYIAESEEVKDD